MTIAVGAALEAFIREPSNVLDGAPWARAVVLPLAVGWIALGWWAMIAACRWWLKQREKPRRR